MSPRAAPIPRVFRRAVALALVAVSVALSTLVLNGIVSSLLAGDEHLLEPEIPAGPADGASCARELTAIEAELRRQLGVRMADAPRAAPAPEGIEIVEAAEVALRAHQRRCGPERGPRGRVGRALARAAEELRAEIGAMRLVWDRYRDAAHPRVRAFEDSMGTVRRRLEER